MIDEGSSKLARVCEARPHASGLDEVHETSLPESSEVTVQQVMKIAEKRTDVKGGRSDAVNPNGADTPNKEVGAQIDASRRVMKRLPEGKAGAGEAI